MITVCIFEIFIVHINFEKKFKVDVIIFWNGYDFPWIFRASH